MKYWIKWFGVAVGLAFIICAAYLWVRIPFSERCYRQIQAQMTLDQVRQIMGFDEEKSNERIGPAGEFERTWTVDDVRITVVFDRTGHSSYKEFGPDFCGVTPLSGDND